MKRHREKRTLQCIAEFENGFAKNWFFQVGDFFRDQLDIKYLPRKEPVIVNGRKQYETVMVKGKTRVRVKTKEVWRWTQGRLFSFLEGHVLYDTPAAYLGVWKDALEKINLRVAVIRSTPAIIELDQYFPGDVMFKVQVPNCQKTALVDLEISHLTQPAFVDFLKTGRIAEDNIETKGLVCGSHNLQGMRERNQHQGR